MSIIRIAFGPDDTNREIARRAAPAANVGDFISVHGELFTVASDFTVFPAIRKPPVVHTIEQVGMTVKTIPKKADPPAVELKSPEPAPVEATPREATPVKDEAPQKKLESFSVRYKDMTIQKGTILKSKDTRRPNQRIEVVGFDPEHDLLITSTGNKIKTGRLSRYILSN